MLSGIAKFLLTTALVIGFFLGVGFLVQGGDFFLYRFFAPREEAVRREVFEQSKSYNDGMLQELRSMQMDYVQADAEHRDALAAIVLHRTAGYDVTSLPADLQDFIRSLQSR